MNDVTMKLSGTTASKTGENFFLITSYGRTATFWIAKKLNEHPDIVCSHGPIYPPVLPGKEDSPSDNLALEMHRNLDTFLKTPIEKVLEGVRQLGRAKIYGNVHAYSANSVKIMINSNMIQSKLNVVNLIRHPVTRIESFKNRFHYELMHNMYFRNKVNDYARDVVDKELMNYLKDRCKINFSANDTLFLYALCLVPFNDALDLKTDIVSIPMERLTKEPEVFCWMFNIISHGSLRMDSNYLAEIYFQGRLNVLSEEKSAIATYFSWQDWMRDAFHFVAQKYNFPAMYNKLHYDFSFV